MKLLFGDHGRARRGVVALAASAGALAGCDGPTITHPAGPVGQAELTIIIDSLVIMLAIVLPTIAAIAGFAFWFRAGNSRARRLPDWTYSGRIELVTWSIPLLTITLLGGVIWVGAHRLDPAADIARGDPAAGPGGTPLDVDVVALDWKWLFIYPEQRVASVNALVLPAGRPVRFSLTSASVLNTFFVPQLGSMIYVMNGMTSRLNLRADQPGAFRGQSSHFSGDGFPGMHFPVRAVDEAGFADWVGQARDAAETLDTARYAALERQSRDDPPRLFRDVDPGLFDAIVAQRVPPAPGPQEGLSNATPEQVEH